LKSVPYGKKKNWELYVDIKNVNLT
jgi:hypothetical protein